ncbi:MAG TPA: flagellar basal body L-ring protein FlgH [Rhizomicrobium sp.]|jgi:flagellar L-ring protein precursor FlgH|nr:flagellar basal body L-ring protein FlgH [Rhizomicrobium sp.]
MLRPASKIICLAGALGVLAGCSAATRIGEIGDPPALAAMSDPASPVNAAPPALPIPPPPEPNRASNSLWASGSRSFFHDSRASRPGDIITVNITVADAAKFSNTTSRTRTNADGANLTNFFGLEGELANALPQGADPSNLVKMGSNTSNVGSGTVDRSESISLTLAALVTQVLPNGNMVIGGHQQVRVNDELRDLQVAGIVRSEDITSANTVDLSQIAEARISYGGRGTVSDVQTPRYGSQLFDILMPF